MNKTQKFVVLLAILPLVLVLVTLGPDLIGDSDVENVGSQDGNQYTVILHLKLSPDEIIENKILGKYRTFTS